MPTMVGTMKKDLCFDAFKKQMRKPITKKAFQIGVAMMRAGEKHAVKVSAALFLFLQSVCLVSLFLKFDNLTDFFFVVVICLL